MLVYISKNVSSFYNLEQDYETVSDQYLALKSLDGCRRLVQVCISVLNPSYSVSRASRGRERGRCSDSGRVLGGEKEGAKCSVLDRVLDPFRVLGRGRRERSEREKARERSDYVSRFLPNLALIVMIAPA